MEFGDAATGESLHAEAMVLLYLGVADFLPSFLPRRDDVDEFVAPPSKARLSLTRRIYNLFSPRHRVNSRNSLGAGELTAPAA